MPGSGIEYRVGSEIGFDVDSCAVEGDGSCGGAVVHEEPRRQELVRSREVGGDLLLEDSAAHLVTTRTQTDPAFETPL